MGAQIIDGKLQSNLIKDELKVQASELIQKGITPTLAVILVGENPASMVYVRNKKRACAYIGIQSLSFELPMDIGMQELLDLIQELNDREDVHGILVQLPLPKQLDEEKVIMAISPAKDVDGFHPINVGNLSIGNKGFVSCTPYGIIELLKRSHISMSGKKCVIIGRSNIVGKPVAMLLIRENATVTICHSRTKDLEKECREADILIAAIGKPRFVNASFIKEGAVIIDVGINRLEDGTLCGDVDFDACSELATYITPVPGGVGPMTIAMLMKNCIDSANNQLE